MDVDFNWDTVRVKTGATANPVAGAEPAEVTVTTGKRWLLLGGMNTIVCGGAAANRLIYLYAKHDGSTTSMTIYQGTPIVAGETVQTVLVPGSNAVYIASGNHQMGLPIGGLELPSGAKFRLGYANIQAADDATAFTYFYKEAPA